MRTPVNLRVPSLAAMTVTVAAVSTVWAQAWAQQSPRQGPDHRILFAQGSNMPLDAGDGGDHNRQAIARAARVLPHWSSQKRVRFVFVAPRSGVCSGGEQCTPEQRLWQRTNATTALIKEAAARTGQEIPFDLIGMAFEDEFADASGVRHEVPAIAAGLASMELRTYVANEPPVAGCPWQISLSDPQMPPVIGEGSDQSIPLTPNATAGVSDEATISLIAAVQEIQAVAIWETPSGEFCMAAPTLVAGKPSPIPRPPVRLHIVSLDGEAAAKFAKSLGDGCRTELTPPKSFVAGKASWSNLTKGLGDNIAPLSRGEVDPSRGRAAELGYCQITFVGTVDTGTTSSR